MENSTVPSPDVEAHLERVLASSTFQGADRSRLLLRFIVEQTLLGRADRLKDYTLGAEALGRGDSFDPRTDPIARVEASRLRSRLDMYYATEGASDQVRIVVPKGGYVPVFEARSAAPGSTGRASAGLELADGSEQSSRVARRLRGWLPLAAAAIAAATTGWLVRPQRPPANEAEAWVEITTPPTTDPASLAISPDGLSIVFVVSDGSGSRLSVRSLADGTTRQLVGTDYAAQPFWSPDGRAIGFFAEGKVKAIDLQTWLVRTLSTAPVPAGAAWNQDGVLLHPLVPDSPLFRTTGSSGSLAPATQLAPGQTGHRGPVFLPDGRHFLFYAAGTPAARGVYVGELDTFAVNRVIDADSPAIFVPPAHILYVKGSTLFAHGFDPASARPVGEPSSVVEPVATDPSAGLPAVSAAFSGTLAYRTGPIGPQRQFMWFDRQGKMIHQIGVPEERGPSYGSLSPDGRRLAMQRASGGNTDIWLVDLESGRPVRLTSEPQADIAPAWSPAGDRIAYSSQIDGVFELFEKPLNQAEARLLVRTGQAKQITDWTRDGRYLLYQSVSTSPPDMDIWAVGMESGDSTPFPVVRTKFEERDGQFSPDGNWIAYESNETGRHEIYVMPFRREGERLPISVNGGGQARWRSDGRELFYLTADGQLMAVSIASDPRTLRPGTPVPLFRARVGSTQGIALYSYLVAPDGHRFLVDTIVEQQPPPISLILNWKRP